MVRVTGLEPVRRSTHAPQTCLSTSSSTLALVLAANRLSLSDKIYYSSGDAACQQKNTNFLRNFHTAEKYGKQVLGQCYLPKKQGGLTGFFCIDSPRNRDTMETEKAE